MQTLNPCPFCGAQPKNPEREGGGDERNGYNFVVVIRCQCGVSMQRHSHRNKQGWCDDSGQAKSEVIKAWNRRAMLANKEKQQAKPVTPEWIWSWLMDWCKRNGTSPANHDSLFKMVSDARVKQTAYLESTGLNEGG